MKTKTTSRLHALDYSSDIFQLLFFLWHSSWSLSSGFFGHKRFIAFHIHSLKRNNISSQLESQSEICYCCRENWILSETWSEAILGWNSKKLFKTESSLCTLNGFNISEKKINLILIHFKHIFCALIRLNVRMAEKGK